jgi:iron complex transport system substrate-binding protein
LYLYRSIRFGGWRQTVVAAVLLTIAVISGCRSSSQSKNTNAAANVPMRQVTDDLGRSVLVPTKINRAISLAPSLTENIFAVGAGDRLVGVTTFCNFPEEAKSIAKIGDTMNPNMESIIALRPDVVFVSTASQIEMFMKTLEANGIAVYVSNPTSLEGVFKDLKRFGELFGNQDIAENLVTDLKRRVEEARCIDVRACAAVATFGKKVEPRTRVFVQISKEPLFTIGKQSFLTDLIGMMYAESVTMNVESAYPKLSKENASALKNSPAVKNGRIYKVNADLLSRPGPRLVDALEQIAKDLHPEKLPK